MKSKDNETHRAKIHDFKQRIRECIQGIPKEMLQRVMTTAMSTEGHGGSPTKCHTQTGLVRTNSHGHGMYLLVLIIFFQFALKC